MTESPSGPGVVDKARYGEDKFVRVAGYNIHYVEFGKGEPVILVPGSFSTYRAWNRVAPLLANKYRLFCLDLPGVGDSDKPEKGFLYTIEEQADLIVDLIAQLGLGRVYLIGSSYGGAIVLNLTARYPNQINRVVSIEGGIVKPGKLPASPLERYLRYPVIGDLFLRLARTGLLNGRLVKTIAGKWYSHMTPDDRKELLEQLQYNARSARRIPWFWISIAHKTSKSFEEPAKSIKAPVLYIYGKDSDFLKPLVQKNLEFFKTYLPSLKVVGLEEGIHDLAMQKPRAVATLILNFFAQSDAGEGKLGKGGQSFSHN